MSNPSPPRDPDVDALADSLRTNWFSRWLARPPPHWWFTRFAFLRLLGVVYFVAFFSLHRQFAPLLGAHGLLPIRQFLAETLADHDGSRWRSLLACPSIFWWSSTDRVLDAASIVGALGSLALVAGATNAILQLALWALYLSFINVGQIFYGYGWETLLVETGFLSVFLCPLRTVAPFRDGAPPPTAVIWLLRWLAFRVMFGAGIIKLRGDTCWRDLTCLAYHYETQPVPNPLSAYLHAMPGWFHTGGVLFNHFVELVVPFTVFGPRRLRHAGGAILVAFQVILIASGNLSFLNWLTIAVCLSCFDDSLLARFAPRHLRTRVDALVQPLARSHRVAAGALVVLVAVLSIGPVSNMLSPSQRMNAAFEPLRLVNSYGAFGSVGRERLEVVIEGTDAATIGPDTVWRAYELPCKPGDPWRRPCVISPYHYRLDWQMWFAAMSRADREPWFIHLVWKLLHHDRGVMTLFANDPFPTRAPRFVRAEWYLYRFHRPVRRGAPWWDRRRIGSYLPAVSLATDDLRAYVEAYGWVD